jgi:hypothetical protein
MLPDPIVEEVRAARDAIARQHAYDLRAIFSSLRLLEVQGGKPIAQLSPREPLHTERHDEST